MFSLQQLQQKQQPQFDNFSIYEFLNFCLFSAPFLDMPEICKYNRNAFARLNELRNLLVRQRHLESEMERESEGEGRT